MPQLAADRGEPESDDPHAVAAAMARHYERWGEATDRTLRQQDASPALAEAAAGRIAHRAWIGAAFADRLRNLGADERRTRVARLAAVCGVELWLVLRRDGGLSVGEARDAVADLIASSLPRSSSSRPSSGPPWVLVTCSTDYQRDEALPPAAVEALRDEPVRVILTLADAYDTVTLPPTDNVRVERFVPHGPVLERAVAVVCHAGMGVVHKAVAAGVPIAAVPFGRDQPEIARRVVEAGAGVRVPVAKLTPESLRAAVREAMGMRASAERAGERLRASGGPERFAAAVEELTGEPVPAAA